jgi:hypothetical protein
MRVSIVACGDSAKEWFKVPIDMSVGVNDCFKFGHNVDHLVCVNSPFKFQPRKDNGMMNRLETILDSRPKKFYCHNSNWRSYFKGVIPVENIAMTEFRGKFRKGRNYFSKTSPFIAICLAVNLGATELILWGIDFVNHWQYKPGNKVFDPELNMYVSLIDELKEQGIKIWIGNANTVLKDYLPLYVLR